MIRVFVDSPDGSLAGWAAIDADFDGTFELVTEEGERFNVNGWTCEVWTDKVIPGDDSP